MVSLLNGPYRVLLADKVWRIGQTLDLNENIPVSGSGGTSLGYIKDARDGGRAEVAAITFEPIVKILLNTAMQGANTQSALNNLNETVAGGMAEVHNLQMQLYALEAKLPSNHQMNELSQSIQAHEHEFLRTTTELAQGEQLLTTLNEAERNYHTISSEKNSLSTQWTRTQQDLQRKLAELANLERNSPPQNITQNTGQILRLRKDIQALGQRNLDLQRRLNNLGLQVERQHAAGDTSAQMRQVKAAVRHNRNHANKVEKALNRLKNELFKVTQERTDIQRSMEEIKLMLGQRATIVDSAKRQAENARGIASNTTNTREDEIVRAWAHHLTGVLRDIESYLFRNLRNAQTAISGRPSPLQAEFVLDSDTIADYEEYLTTLDMVADALEDDEYNLLEKIGKFAASQQYIPGPARGMALLDMNRSKRLEAYRNIIEEILSMGASASKAEKSGIAIGNFEFTWNSGKPLEELEELVDHLANAGLEFHYEKQIGRETPSLD